MGLLAYIVSRMTRMDRPLHSRRASMTTAIGNRLHVPSLMAVFIMLFQLLMPAVARPLSLQHD